MRKKSLIVFPATMLLVLACGDGNSKFQSETGNNYLTFNGRDIAVDSVYCSERMGRVTARFEQGALFVSERDKPPGYEVVLRFTSPERSEYVNRDIGNSSSRPVPTEGLTLDLDRGLHGEIRLMRSMILLNPDRFPDAVPKSMEVSAACPS